MGQQVFATNSLGGYFTNNTLSKEVRYKAQSMQKFRQFVDMEAAAGTNRGNKVFFDKVSNISTAGGTLTETDTIPKRNYTITQGTLTMTEFGNSIPYTQKLKSLSDIQVPETIRTVLMNDMKVVLDSAAATAFMVNDYIATITNTATTTFGTAGTAAATAGANMSDKNVRDIVDQMKKLFIPRRSNDDMYVSMASTNSIRGLYDFFEAKAQLTTMDHLYIGEEIRVGIPTDYGRDQGIAWYALLGFQQVWDFSDDGQTRIITVNSL